MLFRSVPEVGDNQVDAFQFKKEGNGIYDNIIIDGYTGFTNSAVPPVTFDGSVVRIEDKNTNDHQVNTSKIKVTNVKITNTDIVTPIGRIVAAPNDFTVAFPTGNFTTSTTATGAVITTGAWSNVDGTNLIQ